MRNESRKSGSGRGGKKPVAEKRYGACRLLLQGDLDAIAEYIAADSPRRAVSFIREIYAAIERIGEGPLLYRLRPDIGPDARRAVVGRYVVLFRFAKDVVYIERVVYGGRDLPPLFEQ